MDLYRKVFTFPSDRREDARGNGPLNTSQIKQPSRHTSPVLQQEQHPDKHRNEEGKNIRRNWLILCSHPI